MSNPAPPVALTIAGSDPSGGAGLQADLKSFAAFDVYGLSAVTCTTAQVPGEVADVAPVPPHHLSEQLRLLLEAYPVAAIKTGMLYSTELMEAAVAAIDASGLEVPLVVDPVMVATSGDRLLEEDAVEFYQSTLLPRSTLFTPNLDEAAVLLGRGQITAVEFEPAALELHERYGASVLLKGGHLRGDDAVDLLVTDGRVERFSAPFVEGVSTHGTGCTYAAAITAALADGANLAAAVSRAKRYVTAAIAGSLRWPDGPEALDHSVSPPDPSA